jgi:hypothetical protein
LGLDEKIEVSEEKLNSSFQQTWFEIQRDEQYQKITKKNKPSQKLIESIAMESASRAMIQLTLDRLKLIAIGEAPEITVPEITEVAPKLKTAAKRKPKKELGVAIDDEVEPAQKPE